MQGRGIAFCQSTVKPTENLQGTVSEAYRESRRDKEVKKAATRNTRSG